MDVLYYWIMGLMLGLGTGFLFPEWVQFVCSVIGGIMGVLSMGWYTHKYWVSIDKESE